MKIGSALLSAVAIGKDNINFYAAGVFCTPAAYNIIYIMYLPSVIAFGNFEPHGFAAERLW